MVAPEVEEEREALTAIYEGAFTEVQASSVWKVVIADCGASLVVRLPADYPHGGAPEPRLEFEDARDGGHELAASVAAELQGLWEPGTGCVFTWVEHTKEALLARMPESPPPPSGDDADTAAAEAPATRGVALTGHMEKQVGPSLTSAGFTNFGPGIFSHSDRGVTVEVVGGELTITVDGVDAEDLVDWAGMQLAVDTSTFGARLGEWVDAQRAAEPGFLEGGEDDGVVAGEGFVDFLPTPEALHVTRSRELLIYTWGKALRKAAPPDSEANFNAGILNGRGGGADLRTENGTCETVQRNVASCALFPRWIEMVIAKVEGAGLKTISINCTKGRHRSVAAAEILKMLYYPQATTKHLTIY